MKVETMKFMNMHLYLHKNYQNFFFLKKKILFSITEMTARTKFS